jgi:3-deoxy-D-manno-octulosonate 8-phosphate phosphatase KdsC-like HAD superfamily phosphatase
VKKAAHYVAKTKGGRGVVREVIDMLIAAHSA